MNIEDAEVLCKLAHKGQFRKAKSKHIQDIKKFKENHPECYVHTTFIANTYNIAEPYHTHPFAVADMMDTDDEKIVAYLHDVIEDTDAKLYIEYGNTYIEYEDSLYPISLEQYVALQAITKGTYETTEGYLLRVAESKLATKVKIADMFHNMATNPTDKQKNKYLNGIKILLKEI